jgi:hypothetical protein
MFLYKFLFPRENQGVTYITLILSVENLLVVLDSILEPLAGTELPKEVFTSRAR